MITPSEEYERFLAGLVNPTTPSPLLMRLPLDEKIYQIDLNTRKIEAPSFIGVENDHRAEYIFFEMDRFYDMMDLSETVGAVIFKNAKNEEYILIIPYYDIYSHHNKIIFPWVIQAPAALYNGTVYFSFKFFRIDPTTLNNTEAKTLVYELNTTIAKTKVLTGWADMSGENRTYHTVNPQSILIDNPILDRINTAIRFNKLTVYWLDADNVIETNDNQDEDYEHILDEALPDNNNEG